MGVLVMCGFDFVEEGYGSLGCIMDDLIWSSGWNWGLVQEKKKRYGSLRIKNIVTTQSSV